MNEISMLPRWMHRLWAWVSGHFWTGCPTCGRCFGGHEWKDWDGLSSSITVEVRKGGATGNAICPVCTRMGIGDPRWLLSH